MSITIWTPILFDGLVYTHCSDETVGDRSAFRPIS